MFVKECLAEEEEGFDTKENVEHRSREKIGVFLHKTCSRYSKMNVAGRQVHSKTYLNKA